MHEISDVDVEKDILEENRKEAAEVNKVLSKNDVVSIELVGAIGSGKTSIIEEFSDRYDGVGAIVGDVSGEDDYDRMIESGVEAINLNTGKECHLDAHLIKHALEELSLDELNILFFENVGNLVCPADFELGAHSRWVVVSVTEGDDVVNKHPLIFKGADAAVINKIDLSDAVDADVDKMFRDAKETNPRLNVVKTSLRDNKIGVEKLFELVNL